MTNFSVCFFLKKHVDSNYVVQMNSAPIAKQTFAIPIRAQIQLDYFAKLLVLKGHQDACATRAIVVQHPVHHVRVYGVQNQSNRRSYHQFYHQVG